MKYDPNMPMPPQEIIDAAQKVTEYFAKQNITGWKLMGLQERRDFDLFSTRAPLPRQYPAFGRTQQPRLVTHVDGDQYVHIGTAYGAGKSRGEQPSEVYRSIEDGRLWKRTEADFAERMK